MNTRLKKRFFFAFLLLATAGNIFAANNLVILVENDMSKISNPTSDEKNYISSAFQDLQGNLSLIDGISVRTETVEQEMRKIQAKSQIEEAQGLAAQGSASALNKMTGAKLSITFAVYKFGNEYSLTANINDIEKIETVGSASTDKCGLKQIDEEYIDYLCDKIIRILVNKKYIEKYPYNLLQQLTHTGSTDYKTYINDYIKQLEEADKQIAALQKTNAEWEQKAEAEQAERALQLKKNMLQAKLEYYEKLQRQADAEKSAAAKQNAEAANMTKAQREAYENKIKELAAKADREREKELTSSLSLKKRIDLIEADKASLASLKIQLEQYISENNSYFEKLMNDEIAAIRNEPWMKGETDSMGNPTKLAVQQRNKKIEAIRLKYKNYKVDSEKELRTSQQAALNDYQAKINENLKNLESTTYVFQSINKSNDYLSLNVDEFDANKGSWTVYSTFKVNDMKRLSTKGYSLPNIAITYSAMTGMPMITSSATDEAYEKYLQNVEQADLYFRTSVPYVYSEIALTVKYNTKTDKYDFTPKYFRVKKTEDSSIIYNMNELEFSYAIKQQQLENERKIKAAEMELANEAKIEKEREAAAKKAQEKQIKEDKQKQKNAEFERSQTNRVGAWAITSLVNSGIYSGIDINCQLWLPLDSSHFNIGFEGGIFTGSNFNFARINGSLPSSASISGYSISVPVGWNVKFSNLRFYAYTGIGFELMTLEGKSDEDEFGGLGLEAAAGSEIIYENIFTFGIEYKFKYVTGAGFRDYFGLTFGIDCGM